MHIFDGGWLFWGMHFLWWTFWFAVIVGLVALLMSGVGRRPNETPLQILKRRYASGELSTEEYEERKQHLEQDRAKA